MFPPPFLFLRAWRSTKLPTEPAPHGSAARCAAEAGRAMAPPGPAQNSGGPEWAARVVRPHEPCWRPARRARNFGRPGGSPGWEGRRGRTRRWRAPAVYGRSKGVRHRRAPSECGRVWAAGPAIAPPGSRPNNMGGLARLSPPRVLRPADGGRPPGSPTAMMGNMRIGAPGGNRPGRARRLLAGRWEARTAGSGPPQMMSGASGAQPSRAHPRQ